MEHFLIIISILDFNILRSFNWSLCYGINCSGCFFLLSLSWHLMRENRPPFVIFFFVWFYRRLFENEMMEISCRWIEAASFRDALRLSGSLGRLLFCFAIVWGFFAIFFFFLVCFGTAFVHFGSRWRFVAVMEDSAGRVGPKLWEMFPSLRMFQSHRNDWRLFGRVSLEDAPQTEDDQKAFWSKTTIPLFAQWERYTNVNETTRIRYQWRALLSLRDYLMGLLR